MHSREVVAEALRLRDEEGLAPAAVGSRLGVPSRTIGDWFAGKVPAHSRPLRPGEPPPCKLCGCAAHDPGSLPPAYVFLLGAYLGDGSISAHPRGVYRLRLFLDLRYPRVIDECVKAIGEVFPRNRISRLAGGSNYTSLDGPTSVELGVYSKSIPCHFPQHGAGKKHERRIWLEPWQQDVAERWPQALLRGMVYSDGCRFINTGRGGWRHPRYVFANLSSDLTSIYCTACEKLGLRWTAAFPRDDTKAVAIYVSRKEDVARMDEFIGPKS